MSKVADNWHPKWYSMLYEQEGLCKMEWKCKQCNYWVSVDQENGECHYHAPVVIVDGYAAETPLLTAWPETKATDGCAEIKLKQ